MCVCLVYCCCKGHLKDVVDWKKNLIVAPLSAEVAIQPQDVIGVGKEVWGHVGYEGRI